MTESNNSLTAEQHPYAFLFKDKYQGYRDAMAWTDEYMRLHGDKVPDHMNLFGWFANAIETQHLDGSTTAEQQRDIALEALREMRRAVGDHFPPNDCYATGPVTGNIMRDLVQCPACSAIEMHDAALKACGVV